MATRTVRSDRSQVPSTVSRVVGVSAISAGAAGMVASAVGLVAGPRDSSAVESDGAATTFAADRGDTRRRSPNERTVSKDRKDKPDSGRRPNGAVGGSGDSISSERADSAPSADDPRKPDSPQDLKKPSWLFVLRKVGREFGADQCTDLAASLVYRSVLALFPGLLAVVSILGLFGAGKTLAQDLTKTLTAASPTTGAFIGPVLSQLASSNAAGITFIVGVLGALWSASGYVGAFGRAMNRIYDIDEGRPVWKLRPTNLAVTVAVVLLIVLASLILLLSGPIVSSVGGAIGVGPVVVFIWGIVKWPILLAIVVVMIAVLYYFSPNIRQPKFKWTSTGSIIAIVVLAVASVAFVVYLANFAHYNKTYGTLGGVIIFLLWLWIANLALLFGAEWDAELERGRELQAGIAAEEDIQLPPRDTRQADKKAAKHEKDVQAARTLRETRGSRS